MRPLICAACVLLLALPPSGLAAQRAEAASTPPAVPLQLRPGDAVRLAIHDEPELAGEYPVHADGTVLLPLIGLVPVTDEPVPVVVARVRSAYARHLAAEVVLVLEPLVRVVVTGEARMPGVLLVDETYTAGDVLARAGGVLPTAAGGRVILVRDGREYVLRRAGAALLPAVPVRSGDVLAVPRRGWMADNLPVLIGSAASVLAAAVTTLLVR